MHNNSTTLSYSQKTALYEEARVVESCQKADASARRCQIIESFSIQLYQFHSHLLH